VLVNRGQGKGVKGGHGTVLVNRDKGKGVKGASEHCWLIGAREQG
jgi:hypothetical protein